MTFTGTVLRVWPGRRAVIIARLPHQVLRYRTSEDGTPVDAEQVETTREKLFYVWTTEIRGQLMASLCERASALDSPVTLTASETPWGWQLSDVVLAPQEQAS